MNIVNKGGFKVDLIAIGNILNDKGSTIGLRLLDISNNQVKDVDIQSIKSVLKGSGVVIRNIDIVNDELHGSCGSIDSLPKIVNNMVYGKSPMIIISKIDSQGFRVSDWRGKIVAVRTNTLIEYGKVHGISNGKIVDNKYIACKSGEFIMEAITNTRKDKDEAYTGEYIEEIEPLLPVARTLSIYETKNRNRDIIVSYDNEYKKINKRTISWAGHRERIQDIVKGKVYRGNKFTLLGNIFNMLYIDSDKDMALIRMALKSNKLREQIDSRIDEMVQQRRNSCKKDSITGIPLPTRKDRYNPIFIPYDAIKCDNDIDYFTIEKYVQYLKAMDTYIFLYIELDTPGIALARTCTTRGIDYKIIKGRVGEDISTVTLEEIYEKSESYSNVIVDGNSITIIGLDGTYMYDMDLIYKTYKRNSIITSKGAKSALLGIKYNEQIEESGLLRKLHTDLKEVAIPDCVTRINNNSLDIRKTQHIIFNDNIKESGARIMCRYPYYYPYYSLDSVDINCNPKAGLNILKSIKYTGKKLRDIQIKFNRDISTKEYLLIIDSGHTQNVEANNIVNGKISTVFAEKVLETLIQENRKYIDSIMSNNTIFSSSKSLDNTLDKLKTMKTVGDRVVQATDTTVQISDKFKQLCDLIDKIYNKTTYGVWRVSK